MSNDQGLSRNDLVRIGPDAYLSEGQSEKPSDSSDPNLILIFGWMEAQLPHIHKYASAYRRMFPAATQIIFQTPPSFFWSTKSRNRVSLGSAADVISKLSTASEARILVHSFSNGGASQMMNLAGILSDKPPVAQRPSVLVLDSSPGTARSLVHVVQVFTAQIRNPALRIVVAILVGFSFIVLRIVNGVLRRPNLIELLREWLLHPNLFPWMTKDTPRLYLYSKADEMVSWKDVEEHAATAVNKGFDVSTECFEDTPHVAHARKYPDRYWAAVKKLWADAVQVE